MRIAVMHHIEPMPGPPFSILRRHQQAIDDTLYDAFGQRQVSIIFTQLNQYRVILEAQPQFLLTPDVLKKIYVKSTTNQPVPLSAFAQLTTVTAPLAINPQGQFPPVTLSFNLNPHPPPGRVPEPKAGRNQPPEAKHATRRTRNPNTVATTDTAQTD